jgi:hypothetical protein
MTLRWQLLRLLRQLLRLLRLLVHLQYLQPWVESLPRYLRRCLRVWELLTELLLEV